jgi:hypothetical protein
MDSECHGGGRLTTGEETLFAQIGTNGTPRARADLRPHGKRATVRATEGEATMYSHGLILPVLALAAWTFVMWFWMYATRIPAMQKMKIDPQDVVSRGAKLELPPEISRVADNYNHLHEQPTIFYAVALAAQLAGVTDSTGVTLAWLYVLLRVVHSFVQATRNIVLVRFSVFTLASLVLLALLVHTFLGLPG